MKRHDLKNTLDLPDTFPAHETESEAKARITVLYHPKLERIGAISPQNLFDTNGWINVGRSGPPLLSPSSTLCVQPGSIDAPGLGPLLFKVRWHQGLFEVQPAGRQSLSVLDFDAQGQPLLHPIDQTARLKPGVVLAVADRLLLRLHLATWTPPDTDRLGFVGETSLMGSLRRELLKLATFAKPALVSGPTGTGKELVARALHTYSDRADGPWVALNCAALPEHLIESMLFGHKKGAFTGADQDRTGAFQDAEGGTLFLDEVGELPMQMQAKMLRALQEGKVAPVGSHIPEPVDVRVVTATNRALEALVEQGKMRTDFYYRIAVLNLRTPSLRERRWDIPMLFVHFLNQNLQLYPGLDWLWQGGDRDQPPIPMNFFVHMLSRPWLGNVRQLQNVVDQVSRYNINLTSFVSPEPFLTTIPTSKLPYKKLSTSLTLNMTMPGLGSAMTRAAQAQVANQLGLSRRTLIRVLPDGFRARRKDESVTQHNTYVEELIKDKLFGLFDEHAFNQVRLAERLGISRATLIRLMKLYGIPRPSDLNNLEQVRTDTNDDIEAVAKHFSVSPRALDLYLKHVQKKG